MIKSRRLCRILIAALILLVAAPLFCQQPLSIDQGKTGLLLTLRKLRTTGRLMHTAAHPDDEDGGMLTLESRGRGDFVVQMTLTRGEGGQNAVGKEMGDELGMLRTLELLAADQYYGAEQRFSRVADFGFTRSSDETIRKWNGRQTALADLVRVIRTLRPDVIISRFVGDPSDGHGAHQASGILTREAFRAAADPKMFPDQIKEGLQPFQAKKLYVRAKGDDWNVELDVSQTDPLLGKSYVAWAFQGLKHQLSQGAANWQLPTRMHTSHYKLVDTAIPNYHPGHEHDFFDAIDTTLLGLTNIAPNAVLLKPGLIELTGFIDDAGSLAENDPHGAAVPLLKGLAKTKELIEQVKKLPITPAEQEELLVELETKRDQFRDAANDALGVDFHAFAMLPVAGLYEMDPKMYKWLTAFPSEEFLVDLTLYHNAEELKEGEVSLTLPENSKAVQRPGNATVTISSTAAYNRQYWHREDPERDATYEIDNPEFATLPLTPPPMLAHAFYTFKGLTGEADANFEVARMLGKPLIVNGSMVMPELDRHPLMIGPKLSVLLPQSTLVLASGSSNETEDSIRMQSNIELNYSPQNGPFVKVVAPSNWKITNFSGLRLTAGAAVPKLIDFSLLPARSAIGKLPIKAEAKLNEHTFDLGYSVLTRPDLGTAYYFRKATQPVSIVDVKVPAGLKVGYIMGAGDEIPAILKSIGVTVTVISADAIATTDLSQFHTIVLGIRSYDTKPVLISNNARLLDFVKNGGTLMVQYLYDPEIMSEDHLAPYPLSVSRNNADRLVDEDAPVTILAPNSPIFHTPNSISEKDFTGWVQERALYSPTEWDSHYQPLLEAKDPDGPPIKGGLLVAPYGKGTYIWNSWAFFRQLPAGVPGAIRLYVNLLSAGH